MQSLNFAIMFYLTSGSQSTNEPHTVNGPTTIPTDLPMSMSVSNDESSLTTIMPTQSINDDVQTSTDSEKSEATLTKSGSLPLGRNMGYIVGGAVGGLMVVIGLAVAVIIITQLIVTRGRKGSMKVEANGSGVQVFNNALYDKGEETIQCMKSERHV